MTVYKVKRSVFISAVFATVFAVLLGLIAGYRPFGMGIDFDQYLFFYSDIRKNVEFSYFRFEPAFVSLAYTSKFWLGLDYMTFAAILATASLMLKFHVFRRLEFPLLAMLYYMAVWFPLLENTQFRIAVALSILFFATRFLFSQRWIMYAALCFLAFQFHMTAAVGGTILVVSYFLASYRLFIGIMAAVGSTVLLSAAAYSIFLFGVGLNATIGNDANVVPVNVFSLVSISNFLFLVATYFSGSLQNRQAKTFFLVACFSFAFLIGLQSVPVMSNRFREMLAAFMVFIAFEYKITWRTLPQAAIASVHSFGMLYLYITGGFFSD